MQSVTKVGVYVDVSNLYHNGGRSMRYDVLREFACRDGAEPLRLNAYVSHDVERAETDEDYRSGSARFHAALRDYGYKVIVKEVKWYQDEYGRRVGKANADLDLAVDALLQSDRLDRVLLVTGDGDFVRVVRAIQDKGCRVEVLALHNASSDLRREADLFMSGFLVPGLIPVEGERGRATWGEIGSRLRGFCSHYDGDKNYGFIRYLKGIGSGLWITDNRNPDSPYGSVFFHESDLKDQSLVPALPSNRHVLEFDLVEGKDKPAAAGVELVARLPGLSGIRKAKDPQKVLKKIELQLSTNLQKTTGLQVKPRDDLNAQGTTDRPVQDQEETNDATPETSSIEVESKRDDMPFTEQPIAKTPEEEPIRTRSIPTRPSSRQLLDDDIRLELHDLIGEIEQVSAYLDQASPEERATQFRIWALRYRVVAERVGQDKANQDSLIRRSYAVLLAWKNRFKDIPFIEALNPNMSGDWEDELKTVVREHSAIESHEHSGSDTPEGLNELRAVIESRESVDDPYWIQQLHEAVERCAPILTVRDQVAELCEPWRELLKADFGFLWKNKKETKKSKVKISRDPLSSREIVTRMLVRMLGKKKIGNNHTSVTNIRKGLTGKDRKKAEEAIGLLAREGILSSKRGRGQKEEHYSVSPDMVGAVEGFCNGSTFGNSQLDAWCDDKG